jgi:hypothetical protein
MALFTDGPLGTVTDLMGYESAILEVAVTEQIDLTIKLGLAHEEIGIEMEAFLAGQATSVGLGEIVATDPLVKWETFHALAMVYRDAYHRQLNDRYEPKWTEYQRLSQWAREALKQTGVGVTFDPVPRAAKPLLSVEAGANGPATYFARIAWLNAVGEEGDVSAIATLTTTAAGALVVTPVNPPAIATGWNVYVGYTVEEQTLQNDIPVGLAELWMEPVSGIRQGAAPTGGQTPDYYLRPGPQMLWG